jgi:hypothetical protein
MKTELAGMLDRLARWTAARGASPVPPVATGAGPTRGDLLGTASVAVAALTIRGLLRPSDAQAIPMSCEGSCFTQAHTALVLSDAACDAKAKDLTKHYDFFVDSAFVEHQFRVLCYEASQLRIQAELGRCRLACLTGRSSARIAQPKGPPITPPPPPPPPSCPDNTFFCTVGTGGGDVCCVNGYSCCNCGVCCVPAVKCACCGG